MKETLGREFYESADKVITMSRPETFEDYLQRLKDRRTEDDYKYTDEDFEKYKEYISDCCKSGMSVYKCLELMYFAEKDMDDQLFNRESREEIQPEQIWNDEKKEGIKNLIQEYKQETLEQIASKQFQKDFNKEVGKVLVQQLKK